MTHWGRTASKNSLIVDFQHHTSLSDTYFSPDVSLGDSVPRRVAIGRIPLRRGFSFAARSMTMAGA